MKKWIGLLMVIGFALVLVACSSTESSTAAVEGAGTPGGSETSSLAIQLALGTLKLEQTEYAIDAAQAAQLLPLWKAALSLGQSDTTAAAERNGLVKQIQKSMAAEQLEAIQAMGLTGQNLPTIAQELGVELNAGSPSPGSSSTSSTSTGASGGGMTGGPPPDAPGGMPGGDPGGGLGMQTSQSSQTQSTSSSTFMGLSQALLEKVIQLLEAKVQ